jgi:transcriptional regulator with XRE-family HTH domain
LNIQATKLRTWRVDAGFTLQDVSDLTGFSTAMWSRAERGLRRFTPATKALIARRLGVRIGDLFEIEELEQDLVTAEVARD